MFKPSYFAQIRVVSLIAVGIAVSPQSHATLFDRGNGLLYDNVLNITWLQDANYAKTSGYSATGQMSWGQAANWASGLNYAGYSDWRLARTLPLNGNSFDLHYFQFQCTNGVCVSIDSGQFNGSKDLSYNITSTQSELAYMFHVNLNLKSQYDIYGNSQPNFGATSDGRSGGQADVGLVKNLQSGNYWTATTLSPWTDEVWPGHWVTHPDSAMVFEAAYGTQDYYPQTYPSLFAWAVRTGDVGTFDSPFFANNNVFNFVVQSAQQIYIDPDVATGYEYSVASGPNIQSVILPTGIGDNLYQLYVWNGADYALLASIAGGEQYTFAGEGVAKFKILGIETSANLDPTNPTAFKTGLTFIGAGSVSMSQVPVISQVPIPGAVWLMLTGLIGIMKNTAIRWA